MDMRWPPARQDDDHFGGVGLGFPEQYGNFAGAGKLEILVTPLWKTSLSAASERESNDSSGSPATSESGKSRV